MVSSDCERTQWAYNKYIKTSRLLNNVTNNVLVARLESGLWERVYHHWWLCFQLQPSRLWLHLWHTHALDGPWRREPSWRIHGTEGLGRPEGVLQVPGESLRLQGGSNTWEHRGFCWKPWLWDHSSITNMSFTYTPPSIMELIWVLWLTLCYTAKT